MYGIYFSSSGTRRNTWKTLQYPFDSPAISAIPIPRNQSKIFQTFCPRKQNAWKINLFPSLPIFTTTKKTNNVVSDEEEKGLHKNGYHQSNGKDNVLAFFLKIPNVLIWIPIITQSSQRIMFPQRFIFKRFNNSTTKSFCHLKRPFLLVSEVKQQQIFYYCALIIEQ